PAALEAHPPPTSKKNAVPTSKSLPQSLPATKLQPIPTFKSRLPPGTKSKIALTSKSQPPPVSETPPVLALNTQLPPPSET
ncbi:unnamed protein product, partial [Rotaria magnacalcarata]